MRDKRTAPGQSVAEVARRQHGVVTARQLEAIGLDRRATHRRVRAGTLHRVHQGVYAVGHRGLGREGTWMAAVLACGPAAVLSHRSAAEHWGLLPARASLVHVTVPDRGSRRKRKGIRIHRSRTLAQPQTTRLRNIPITSPVRTLVDLGRCVDGATLRQAKRQAAILGFALGEDQRAERTRSELESRFLRLCRRHRLTEPAVNATVGPFTVDFLWRDQCVVVETDGYRYHRGRQAFEDDRARDLHLRLLGYEVLRFSYVQVVEESRAVADALRPLLR